MACGLSGQCGLPLWVCGLIYTIVHLVSSDSVAHQTSSNIINVSSSTAHPVNINDICPGVEYLFNKTEVTIQQKSVSDCEQFIMSEFTTYEGVVYGKCGDDTWYCRLHIQVPQDMFVRVRVQRLAYWCESGKWKTEMLVDTFRSSFFHVRCNVHTLEETWIDSFTNDVYAFHHNIPKVKIYFEAVNKHYFCTLHISKHSGYIVLPQLPSDYTSLQEEVKAPPDFVIMLSFQSPYKVIYGCVYMELIYTEPRTDQLIVENVCDGLDTPAQVFPISYLQVTIPMEFFPNNRMLRIAFSFHPKSEEPEKFPSGMFNCSVNHYYSFQHHLDCNHKTECEDEQDETEHCPFSSPSCQGMVASDNKCFAHVRLSRTECKQAETECMKMSGRIASLKTRKEQEDFRQLFNNFETFRVSIGFISGQDSVPVMYSKFRKWSDRTMIYNINHFVLQFPYEPKRLIDLIYLESMVILQRRYTPRRKQLCDFDFVCETYSQEESRIPTVKVRIRDLYQSLSIYSQTQQVLSGCSGGHVTYLFLSCNFNSHCGQITYSEHCIFLDIRSNENNKLMFPVIQSSYRFVLFKCDDDITTVSYSLVCDFRQDCPDKSDESFCEHPPCKAFLCSNGQCVLNSHYLNGHSDCLDHCDEIGDLRFVEHDPHKHTEAIKKDPLFINFDGEGYFTQQVMKANESCPDTHYRCIYDWLYCLPVYTRCNKFSDCIYGEDEQDCDTVRCLGFYQCKGSDVCVHADHLCDGWSQCPQQDDEWMCHVTCPQGCWCQRHSFLCSQPFSADLFPQLRYLDGRGSGMTLTNFSSNTYLTRLSLQHCSLVDLPILKNSNLHYIDLSRNQLSSVNVNVFSQLSNLKTLILAKNPLTSLTSEQFNAYYAMRMFDLSETHLHMFSSNLFMYLPNVNSLNLSFSAMVMAGSLNFQNVPRLTELDIRGTTVSNFYSHVLTNLTMLKTVFSSNYRFCCDNVLHKQRNKIDCLAPPPIFSSCTQLLPAKFHGLFFRVVSVLTIVGHLGCFMARAIVKNMLEHHFLTFLAHFHIANVCMGIHVSVVTVANDAFRGEYIYFENVWTNSVPCRVAGFFSFLSSEVSVLIIWFITLDHVMNLYFPFTKWRFNKRSTTITCVVTWSVGIIMSVVPFLPGLSHWGLDNQSGFCRLALHDCYNCKQFTWFTVTVILNFILCSLVVVGQVIVFKRTPKYQMMVDCSKRLVYSSFKMQVKVSVTDAVCWLSLGLTSVMALGVTVSDEVHVAMTVFMLPLNCALNPLLYVWTAVTQRRHQTQEKRMLQKLLKLRPANSTKDRRESSPPHT